jgi:hypothetical protein
MTDTEETPTPTPTLNESESKVNDALPESFLIFPNTPIGFGKLKSHPHSDLLMKENADYAKWIFNQGSEFRYNSTRQWLMDNLKENKKKFITIIVRDNENGIEHTNYPTFVNSLLTLTRKHSEFITLHFNN